MRKLASIQTISNIFDVPETDNLQLAQINGWQVVTNKQNKFQVNDKVIYCEIDSILPEMPVYEFLRSKKFRIKTQKIRGVLSQGIIFPLSILYEYVNENLSINDIDNFINSVKIEQDVTNEMKITKYDPDIYIKSNGNRNLTGKPFPEFLIKTDEERIQNLTWLFHQEHTKNADLAIYEKIEGSSISIYLNNGIFGVCSRNLELELTDDSKYIQVVRQYDLEAKMKELNRNICIQAELIGEGIQGNIYKLTGNDMYVFNIYDIDNKQFLSIDEVTQVCKTLGLKEVPRIYVFDDYIKLEDYELKEILNLANGYSKLNSEVLREGLVFKAVDNKPLYKELVNIDGNKHLNFIHKRFSFKAISNEYLLKQK